MRKDFLTADYQVVEWSAIVFEIRWAYVNAEVSLAYPHRIQAYNVPEGYPMWRWLSCAEKRCKTLNSSFPNHKPGKPKPLYDPPRLHPV